MADLTGFGHWTYKGMLLWRDDMLFLTAFGHEGCYNQSSVNLATRYKACQLLASRLGQSVQDDDEHGQRAHTRANNVAAVGCAYAYAGLGELLDCQTIMVMDY